MAKDKMNIPQIRLKGFDENWKKNRLSSIFSIFSGNAFSSKDQVEKGILWLKIADVGIQKMTPNNLSYLPFGYEDTYKKYLIKKDDVVIALTRPILDKHLKIAVAGEKYHGALLNQRVGKIVSSNNHIPFIYCLLQQEKIISDLESSIAGTDPPNLSLNEIKNISLAIPIKEEQTQIGDFFQKIDQVIELQQKALDTARAYKQSMLQKMFPQKGEKVPRVRFAGFSGDWDKYYLADIVHQVRSYSLSRGVETEDYTGVKYIHYGDIHLGKARYLQTDEELSFINFDIDCTVLQQGDLVVADASEDYLGIAEPCVINFEPQTKLVAGLHTIAIRPDQSQNSIFLFYYFKTKQFKKHCYRVGTGMKVFGITFNNLSKYEGYFPNKEEQTAIGNFFQKLDQKIEQQAQKLATYQQLKKAMLQRMFV